MVRITSLMDSIHDILALCQVNQQLSQMLSSEDFWYTAVANRFGIQCEWKPKLMTWKQYYYGASASSITALPQILDDARQEWRLRGQLHRLYDLPAVIHANSRLEWYRNGKLNRDGDQPALIDYDGFVMVCAIVMAIDQPSYISMGIKMIFVIVTEIDQHEFGPMAEKSGIGGVYVIVMGISRRSPILMVDNCGIKIIYIIVMVTNQPRLLVMDRELGINMENFIVIMIKQP